MDEEEVMMRALEAGEEDFTSEETHFEIYSEVGDFAAVRNALHADNY